MINNFSGKYGPLLIAEIGGNHEGNFEYAKKLLRDALKSDVDVIKFQIYFPETLVNKNVDYNRFSHFKKFTLSKEQHIELAKMCRDAGKQYLASVWDTQAIDWIDEYCDFYKIGSGDLTALELIDAIIKKNKPIILSTGLSTSTEISQIVSYIISKSNNYNNPKMLALLQCTSMYPIDEDEANLNVLNYFKEKFNVTVGYSDHTEHLEALFCAVSIGAKILEFHYTDNKNNTTFRDHKVSLDNNDISILINRIKRLNKLLGSHIKSPTKSEISNKHVKSFRRAVYFKKNMTKGQIVTKNDLISLRPNQGIDAREFHNLIGKKLRVDVEMLQELSFKMFI